MLSSKIQFKVLVVSTLAGSLFLTGCATKKFVRQQVALEDTTVDKKIAPVVASVKDNSERIDAVDVRARQGIANAATAQAAAGAAQTTATQGVTAAATAQTAATAAGTAAATANQGVQTANTRIAAVDAKFNSLDRYTAGPVQTVMFKVGKSDLSDDAKKTLDGVAGPLASQPSGFQVEIQGFASAEGKESDNVVLSQARAESVQRYLITKGVPLIRVSIVGIGPVGEKKTKADREANRKVEVRVFNAVKP